MSSDFTPFGETGVREGGGRRIFDNLSRVFIIARKAPRAIAKAILPCYTLGEKTHPGGGKNEQISRISAYKKQRVV